MNLPVFGKEEKIGQGEGCFPSFFFRAIYSNSSEIFKRPKNREDSSDLDENLSESIAATQTCI